MHEFDRFFDCYDVFCKILIDVINQRGLRGGFAGTSRAGDKDKTAAQISKIFYYQWNAQVLERGNLRGNQPKSRTVTV